jgi:hypothetical protein
MYRTDNNLSVQSFRPIESLGDEFSLPNLGDTIGVYNPNDISFVDTNIVDLTNQSILKELLPELKPSPVLIPTLGHKVGNKKNSDLLTQLRNASAEIVSTILADNLDLVNLVKDGGTTGSAELDAIIQGALQGTKKSFFQSNMKYFLIIGAILALIIAKKKRMI